ncbi:MAG TPA: DUF4124 domain-containing protein [Noviherbaspirillum sp.]|uniref:DUF4124 domain-containing protein n=1 Tax=Noviherbaspirillum sp. TaxID=1926288 RepID=UPI002B489601|nr:DUF4124 domain-containing protein [Noviherbaspirillum sp.]HJV86418.1 DUF4124 domain-containing protein [Noviherbaspirillum sp.]
MTRFLIACLCSFSTLASAQVYKCTDERGNKTYSDKPCAEQGLRSTGGTAIWTALKQVAPSLLNAGFSPIDVKRLPSPLHDIMRIFLSTGRAVPVKDLPVAGRVMPSGSVPSMTQRREVARLAAESNNIVVLYEREKARLDAAYPFACDRDAECMRWNFSGVNNIKAAKWCAIVLVVGEDLWRATKNGPSWEEFLVCENGAGENVIFAPPPGIRDAANPGFDKDRRPKRLEPGQMREESPAANAPAAPDDYYPGPMRGRR